MLNVSHYTKTGEVHPDLLALPVDVQRQLLLIEEIALSRCEAQVFNKPRIQEEIARKKQAVKKLLYNL